MEKALDKVGARLRSVVKEDRAKIAGVENCVVANALGEGLVTKLLGPNILLGEFAAFERIARSWAVEHGASPQLGHEAARMVELTAYAKLYDPSVGLDLAMFSLLVDEALSSGLSSRV